MSQLQLLADAPVTPGERRAFDFYPTPGWMTHALLLRLPSLAAYTVLEPCSGNGDIVRVLEGAGATVVTNDFDPQRPALSHLDAGEPRSWDFWKRKKPEWVITNPPFDQAARIVPLALEHASRGVAMLLRLSWLEPTDERGDLLRGNTPKRLIVMPRYSFRQNGSTDNVTSAWFVWDKRIQWGGLSIVTRGERDGLIAMSRTA